MYVLFDVKKNMFYKVFVRQFLLKDTLPDIVYPLLDHWYIGRIDGVIFFLSKVMKHSRNVISLLVLAQKKN